MADIKIKDLYSLDQTQAKDLLSECEYPWEALPKIKDFILEFAKTLSPDEYDYKGDNVWISKTAKIYPNNYIAGPCIIGPETEVRPGAFIRGNALVGEG